MISATPRETLQNNSSATPMHSPPRWRLPQIAWFGLIAFFLACVLAGARPVAWVWTHGPAYSDLRIFMTGVEMMKNGQRHQLYSFAAQQQVQNRLYPDTRQAGLLPFNHLAYELLVYWPLARLPFGAAQRVWGLLNLGLLFLIAWLLHPFTEELRAALRIPLPLWLLAFYPVLIVLGQSQDSLIFLCLVVLSLRFANNKRDGLSGFFLGLALFKVHLALGFAFFVFVLPRKWRALAAFAFSAFLVAAISWLMVGPRFVYDYLGMVSQQEAITPWGFRPLFMPNLRGLLQWRLGSWEVNSVLSLILLLSLLIVGATWIALRAGRAANARELYASAILATVLVSYHLHMPDLSLAIPAMLVLLDACVTGQVARVWTWAAALSIACLYLYGVATWPFPTLALRGAVLALPVALLWVVAVAHTLSPETIKQI
jgi:Glycosyltransferase family 87